MSLFVLAYKTRYLIERQRIRAPAVGPPTIMNSEKFMVSHFLFRSYMTYTNYVSYVNGYKVTKVDSTTVTLENGLVVNKSQCRYVSADHVKGATYYRYEEE